MESLKLWWLEFTGQHSKSATIAENGQTSLHATQVASKPVQLPPRRRVFVNLPLPDDFLDGAGIPTTHYLPNKIKTSKYNVVNFIPKNLWEQFHRIANVFFLAMAVSQVFAVFQVTNAFMPFVPLAIVLTFTAIKDAWEDYKRHKSDRQLNSTLTKRLGGLFNSNYPSDRSDRTFFNGSAFWKLLDLLLHWMPCLDSCLRPHMQRRRDRVRAQQNERFLAIGSKIQSGEVTNATYAEDWETVTWSNLRVGDFVFLEKDDLIPADILVLSTSDSDNVAYVETKNLDGETNLKSKTGPVGLRFLKDGEACRKGTLWLDSEGPNMNLYSYTGVILLPTAVQQVISNTLTEVVAIGDNELSPTAHEYQSIPLNISNLLLRGSVLRNTNWVIGLVAYTGMDTKILLNAGKTPHKKSRIERKMNGQVLIIFGILVLLCLGVTIAHMFFDRSWQSMDVPWYNSDYVAGPVYGLITFWSAMILFQNLIPISLYVTIEIAKILQAFFIFMDIDLYYEDHDQPCVPKNWSIADDLGQISYIFSDKTGTLTMNKMEFRKCDIRGMVYGEAVSVGFPRLCLVPANLNGTAVKPTHNHVDAGQSMNVHFGNSPPVPSTTTFHDAHLLADMSSDSVCAQDIDRFFKCLALCHTVATSIDPTTGAINYSSESPDEQALILSARDVGYVLKERTQRSIAIEIHGTVETYTLLQVLDFNSARKRMSVIVKKDGTDQVLLLTKGADSMIYPRLAADDAVIKGQTWTNLEKFAEEGLRTLCLAQRLIPPDEYQRWQQDYDAAASALTGREAALDAVYDAIECDLELLGATAIEDRLQDSVPECIALLREAGINIWVLTGDKVETAITIGYSCNLLEAHMELIVVRDAQTASKAYEQLKVAKARVTGPQNPDVAISFGLVVDGETIKHAFETEEGSLELLEVGLHCRSVICCRVTPKQKALVVRLAKKHLGCMCLAVGDGANDVGMIQEANVGVGIAGAEGLQAAMASDYVIGQFRFLAKLLLVHGRWSYMRCSEMILNFFYKSIVWVFSLFWYQCFAGFSTDVLFEYTIILFFNLIFTSLPVLVIGIFEQDVGAKTSVEVPQLFWTGIFERLFTIPRFILFVLDGLVQSVFVYFCTFAIFNNNISWPAGYGLDDKLFLGSVIACYGITVANLTVATNILNWTWIAWVVMTFELVAVFLYLIIYGSIRSLPDLYDYWRILFGNLDFWLGLFLVCTCCVGPSIGSRLFWRTFFPRDVDIVREIEVYGLPVPEDKALGGGGIAEAEAVLHGTLHNRGPGQDAISLIQDGLEQSSTPHLPEQAIEPTSKTTISRRMSVYSTLSRKSETYTGYAFDKTDPTTEKPEDIVSEV